MCNQQSLNHLEGPHSGWYRKQLLRAHRPSAIWIASGVSPLSDQYCITLAVFLCISPEAPEICIWVVVVVAVVVVGVVVVAVDLTSVMSGWCWCCRWWFRVTSWSDLCCKSVPLLGTLGCWSRPRNIISKIFLQVTLTFSLDGLRSRKCHTCHTLEFSNSQFLAGS